MGLTTLWSNIIGPRDVKEIEPQPQCSWLERNRPSTSASTRKFKKIAHLQLKSEANRDSVSTIPQDGKKKKRSLSISRPRLLEESRKEFGMPGSNNVPDVPAIPPMLSPQSKSPSDELVRPRTANTTSGSASTTERFELSGNGLSSPSLHSPLPSPRSPISLKSPQSNLMLRTQEDISPEHVGGLRQRSNSTASGKPKVKRASWFVGGVRKKSAESDLPPPLPPPSCPPPPPPVDQPLIAELPDTGLPVERKGSDPGAATLPFFSPTKTSLDGDSILNAFPSVPLPTPSRESPITPAVAERIASIQDSSLTTSLSADVADHAALERQSSPLPSATRCRPIAVPTQTIDSLIAPKTPTEPVKHDSKALPPLPAEATPEKTEKEDTHHVSSFSEELQQEYDRLLEAGGEQPKPGVVMGVVEGLEFKMPVYQSPQKFSNDEALSKLEFGIL